MSRARAVQDRILGLETEYGCLINLPRERVLQRIRDWAFEGRRHGLIDLHHRGWDEPPGNGGFLFNGGRLYIDMGHLEYCTPECRRASDVVRYDRAGDHLLLAALDALGIGGAVSFFRNNIDHHTGATFGCHENYSLSRAAPLSERNVLSLLAFLTARILFTGSGRVGENLMRPGARPAAVEPAVPFQISQRADYIENDFYEWVQHNRAIINTRDEPLADALRYRRLHLLHGDTHVVPAALFLKLGATRLVLDLLECDDLPRVALQNAVESLRRVSRRTAPPWRLALLDGSEGDAVEILETFRERAHDRFGGRDAETDAVLALWARVDAALASDPAALVGLVDWVTKLHLLERFRAAEDLDWSDPWLQSQDLEYHHLDPARSLGLALADNSGPWGAAAAEAALDAPPADTRAAARVRLMREIAAGTERYELDWDRVEREGRPIILLRDPFDHDGHEVVASRESA